MTTTIYTQEDRDFAQRHLNENRGAILAELDTQAHDVPQVYQQAPFFCQMAREGRVISGATVESDTTEKPCGCYYGITAHFDQFRGYSQKRLVADCINEGSTPIETFLFCCTMIEEAHFGQGMNLVPIPWENPALQLLVELIEHHLAESSK